MVPRHGRSAVDRNKLKRRMREIVRRRLLSTLPAVDLVIRARPSAYAIDFATLELELVDARIAI